MDQNQETATSYYNNNRKRSFFLSRIFVIISMLVLVITLGINISVLYSQQRTSTTSQASDGNTTANLPDLPQGCEYQSHGKGVIVVCPTEAPEVSPTTASETYTACVPGKASNTLDCTDAQSKTVAVPLPSLPGGCEYRLTGRNYVVDCSVTTQSDTN